jgi:amidophosphoribosyltransferase
MDLLKYFLDQENDRLWLKLKQEDNDLSAQQISEKIGQNLDMKSIFHKATEHWDGGFVIAGLLGHGEAFVLRDKYKIRPVFYYKSDEVVVVASERPAIMTTFKVIYII